MALVAGAALAAIVGGLWIERRPIASHVIDDTLAGDKVPARYHIADLGPGRQRLTDVVIGDPAHPDLVADWIETATSIGLDGVRVTGVRAGHVRVRARLVDGRLTLGAIDRLLPHGPGGGPVLPAIVLDVVDARLRLETPMGVIGARLSGHGRLDRGFDGRLAVTAATLTPGACRIAAPHALLQVTTRAGAIRLAGPLAADLVRCGASVASHPTVALDVTLSPDLARWSGTAQVAAATIADPRGQARALAGQVVFGGTRAATTGTLALQVDDLVTPPATVTRAALTGRFGIGAAPRFDGELVATGARLDAALIERLRCAGAAAAGTPLSPLGDRAGQALAAAAARFGGTAQLTVADGRATVTGAALTAASGATLRFAGTLPLADPRRADGTLAVSGGGLPAADLTVTPRPGGTVEGALVVAPYQAGDTRLALSPVAFAWAPGQSFRAQSVATLTGPFAGGSVDRLALPLVLGRDAAGTIRLGERCTPVSAQGVRVGGLALGPTRLTLCPVDGALVAIDPRGGVTGGATVGPLHLTGQLGGSPLDLTATGLRATLADRGARVAGLVATLGPAGRQTRLTAATLDARAVPGGVGGMVTGLGGQIGAVPLLLADGSGDWRVAGGVLALTGHLTVLDAASPSPRACTPSDDTVAPRFCPMLARDVALRLADGRIDVTGTLAEPTTGRRVAGVTIAHDLASGAGHADLAVERLAFDKTFQPEQLTPVTRGVVADVAGTIDGAAHIGWTAAGVTSNGRFSTADTDLAAAFGPVKGVAGSIAFTDLLSLTSAPGQVITVRSINPGIMVENGTVRFHLEPGVKVAVEDAWWPFAGGRLTLDPTLLDFSQPAERHMTFEVAGAAADQFLQQFDFQNLTATGIFDGRLPMVFDATGGRIEHGELTVRPGGGTLAYVGDVSQKDLGTWGNLAFQALKSLRYRSLAITMNGPLAGEMVTEVRFAGISQGPGAKSNFLIRRLQRLPFVFNVTIKAPFRTLLDGLDPVHQAQLALPRLIEQERQSAAKAPVVQPPASETVP